MISIIQSLGWIYCLLIPPALYLSSLLPSVRPAVRPSHPLAYHLSFPPSTQPNASFYCNPSHLFLPSESTYIFRVSLIVLSVCSLNMITRKIQDTGHGYWILITRFSFTLRLSVLFPNIFAAHIIFTALSSRASSLMLQYLLTLNITSSPFAGIYPACSVDLINSCPMRSGKRSQYYPGFRLAHVLYVFQFFIFTFFPFSQFPFSLFLSLIHPIHSLSSPRRRRLLFLLYSRGRYSCRSEKSWPVSFAS